MGRFPPPSRGLSLQRRAWALHLAAAGADPLRSLSPQWVPGNFSQLEGRRDGPWVTVTTLSPAPAPARGAPSTCPGETTGCSAFQMWGLKSSHEGC